MKIFCNWCLNAVKGKYIRIRRANRFYHYHAQCFAKRGIDNGEVIVKGRNHG